jgi:hypothetical protein
MGHAQRILPSYTYDDYAHWEGRWELIDGIPFAMSPLPSPKHQRIASELRFQLRDAIKIRDAKHAMPTILSIIKWLRTPSFSPTF